MTTSVNETTIIQALRQVPQERWPDILRYVTSLQSNAPDQVDAETIAFLADTTWSAGALQQLPVAVQTAVLREQARRLVTQYQRDPHSVQGATWWTAGEIGRLPVEQRDILLEASAIVAADEYNNNPELTAFDAFGEDDIYGDSASSEPLGRIPPAADAR
jgi:hypothetical protein